jgi:hypothetical protein
MPYSAVRSTQCNQADTDTVTFRLECSMLSTYKKVKVSHNRPRRPKGFLDFLDVRHYEGGRSSALRTGRLYPRRNPWYSFLGPSRPQGTWLSVTTEKSPDTTGNRSRDHLTSSTVAEYLWTFKLDVALYYVTILLLSITMDNLHFTIPSS